jgi:hypothetical protein
LVPKDLKEEETNTQMSLYPLLLQA